MDLTPSERLQSVVRYLAKKTGRKQYEIATDVGYTNRQAFSAVLNGKAPIPKAFPDRIAALDPEINPDFLTGASDKMLLSSDVASDTVPKAVSSVPAGFVLLPEETCRAMQTLINSQAELIRSLQQTIDHLRSTLPNERGNVG